MASAVTAEFERHGGSLSQVVDKIEGGKFIVGRARIGERNVGGAIQLKQFLSDGQLSRLRND
jgi:hypothetical protein